PSNGGASEAGPALGIFNRIKLRTEDYQELFDSFPMPLVVFSLDSLRILAANAAAINFYGYTRDEFLARTVAEIQASEKLQPFLQLLRDSRPGFTRHGLWRHQTKAGQLIDVDLSWVPLLLESDPCRLMLVHDITERRWAEQLLVQVHNHTEKLLNARTMELDVAAQEVESFSQALLKMAATLPPNAGGAESPTARRLEQLCESLMRLSRMTYQPLRPEDIDLAPMARQIAEDLAVQSEGPLTRFIVPPQVKVRADPELMRIVLTNLFRNAWVYTRQHGAPIIEFGLDEKETEIICFVRDDGVGFEPAMAQKIFRPFQRFDPEHKGEGIGLSMVRRIIAKHSGKVWAQGTPHHGATIFFSLPKATGQVTT
ncbi:MAG TPA: ATP-binding protein, partial [Verrucomicrobiae bacterium]